MRTTKLFIDNGNGYAEVDLYDNLDIPITYNVADVKDISKKDSNFSLTVKMPNTTNNAQLFDVIHDIARYNSTFELLKQYPAFVEVDHNRTFEGYFKLTKVVINDDKEISYEGNLYSNVIEFMKRLGTTTLRGNANSADDLSFIEYIITLTDANWFDYTDMFTWDGPPDPDNPPHPTGIKAPGWGKGFYFAPVDKYNFGARLTPTWLNGAYGESVPLFFDEFTPFLFYKEIWEKIFEWAGFSFVSDFINGNNNTTPFEFDHLAYPAVNFWTGAMDEVYTKVVEDDQFIGFPNSVLQCYWARNMSFPYPADAHTGYVDCYSNPYNYLTLTEVGNTSTMTPYYKTTISRAGVYSISVRIPFDVWIVMTNATGSTDSTITDTITFDDSVSYTVRLQFILKRGGVSQVMGEKIITGNYESSYISGGGTFPLLEDELSFERNLYLEPGDELFLKWDYNLPVGGMYNGNYKWVAYDSQNLPHGFRSNIRFLKTELGSNQIDLELLSDFSVGATFDPTVILNPKRKKTDFILDIIRKFNLYIEDVTDKKDQYGVYYRNYPGVRLGEPILRVEPREMYYQNDHQTKNWTAKTDVSTIEFGRIDDYVYNLLDFNDKNDKTFLIDDYNGYNYTEGEYGEEIITSPFNTSEDNKTEIKTDLGQTMCCRPLYVADENTYIECPSILTINNDGSIKKDKEHNDRMLFVFNVYPREDVHNVYGYDWSQIQNDSKLQSWAVFRRNNSYPDDITHGIFYKGTGTYILLDHLNVPFGKDTADLNFGWANWYYQYLNGTWVTDNNCYNTFYGQMVDEYNSPDSRIMTCKMFLSPSDIRDLKLSDTIIVNNVAYHINKINQWKNGNTPTQVELIKDLTSFTPSVINPKGPAISRPPQLPTIFQPAKLITDMGEVQQELSKFGDMIRHNSTDIGKNTELVKAMEEMLKKLEERVKKLETGDSGKGDSTNTGTNTTSMAFSKQEKKREVLKTSPSEPAPLSAHQQYLKSLGAKFDSPPYI